ncbi:hypothetical protein AB0F17_08095 [Nonomuraea sp. NPDC026600]|uniref:hypothetical protein n=1 Tax=Nonomuraea sp. NPDC026600 TaxID=3155363 RepID=UPI0033F70055
MNPDETAAYYDDPAHAANMCDLLMRTYPGWMVWRDDDRRWRTRHADAPDDRPPIAYRTAGLLNRTMYRIACGRAS